MKKKRFPIENIIALIALLATFTLIYFAYQSLFKGTGDDNAEIRSSRRTNLAEFEAKGRRPELIEQFDVSVNKKWFLKGDQFGNEDKIIHVRTNPSEELNIEKVGIRFDENDKKFELTKNEDEGFYYIDLNTNDLEAGIYTLQVASADKTNRNKEYVSAKVQFFVTYPLYVSWTMDWEGLPVNRSYLQEIDQISAEHGIPIVQFYNPRNFVGLSKSEAQYQTNYVLNRMKNNGDEIALHLHMWYDMVRAAGLTPITEPQWNNYGNGRDVPFSEYNKEQSVQLLNWAKQQFVAHGLPEPKSFRAGGWFTDDENLAALVETGFVIESSGRDADARGRGSIRGNWNLGPKTRPYHPSKNGINLNTEPFYETIWEYPNNCGDSWKYTDSEMIQCFYDNLDTGILDWPQMITYLSHPHWFYRDGPKVRKLFGEIGQHLYKNDAGPVIYSTQKSTLGVWDSFGNRQ